MRLILASTSKYRRALLGRLRVPFEAIAPGVEETPLPEETPEALVRRLSAVKARAVFERHPGAVVIGSDQVAELDGEVLGKPGTQARAVEQLARLAGRTHRLLTGLCVLAPGSETIDVDVHLLTMRALSQEQLARYAALDDPIDCAGAYKIESLGAALFAKVEGEDPTAIEGLPLMRLASRLAAVGLDVLR